MEVSSISLVEADEIVRNSLAWKDWTFQIGLASNNS
jgi:hypothetical protein